MFGTEGGTSTAWRIAGTIGLFVAAAFPMPALQAADQATITIEETQWGFDGAATAGLFTPLFVQVQNHGATAVSGQLELRRRVSLTRPIEFVQTIDYDIPPFDQRWVQFVPCVLDRQDDWVLSWGNGAKERLDVPPPRMGDKAVVLLVNKNDLPQRAGTIRRFPADHFPVSLTATDSLDALVLNSVPDLAGARRQAMMDWLSAGGRLFLLHDDTGRFPRFPESLAELNQPSDQFHIGAGLVRRLPMRAAEVDAPLLTTTLMSRDPGKIRESKFDAYSFAGMGHVWDRNEQLLGELSAAARFERRWWLIYGMALLYLLSLFPGTYLVGRRARIARWFYAIFFGVILIFSTGFISLAKVGSGARNRIRTATIAKCFGPGLYDVTQWLSLGAVDGDRYTLTHSGSGRWYSSGSDEQSVVGRAFGGSQARFELDIPPSSTRSLIARFRSTGPDPGLRVETVEYADQRLVGLSLAAVSLPEHLLGAYAALGDKLYHLQRKDLSLIADIRSATTTAVFATEIDFLLLSERRMSDPDFRLMSDSERTFRSLERRMIGNAFGARNFVDAESMTVPRGMLRVLLFEEDASSFTPESTNFPDRQGCVLFVVDLPVAAG